MNTTLVNETPFDVLYVDGSKETLRLPRLSLRQLYTWAKLMRDRDTPALVCLCTGRPPEWIDSLDDLSFATLAQKCVEMNFTRAMEIAKTDPSMAALVGPILAECVEFLKTAEHATRGLKLNEPLPAPPRSESAEASGSGSST